VVLILVDKYTVHVELMWLWQDTNRNLRAVDKMLERYKDIGEQKAAVVHAVCVYSFYGV